MKSEKIPKVGVDYPRTYQEFLEWFPDEASCRNYIQKCRWPHGFECVQCGSREKPWTTNRGYLHCRHCGSELSITAGTIFERTRTPLRTWFSAMWFVTSQKGGASALGLKNVLGFGSYQTAWTLLHKLRHAMVRSARDQLCGRIEIDETYVGGVEEGGKRGRGCEKAIVIIAVELHNPKGYGRIRMRQIPDVSSESLVPFVCDVAKKGSVIITDGWPGYTQLSEKGYEHERIILSHSDQPAHVSMPGVHRVASLLKRWLLGTHQGAFSRKHLEYYLDEYTFRFNRRSSRSRGMLFYRLMQQAATTPTITYRQIVDRSDTTYRGEKI